MASKKQQQNATGNLRKDPQDWVTGDEPRTGAQQSYLTTRAQEAGEPVKEDLTKAEASERIDELQEKTGRGVRRTGKKGSSRKGGKARAR
jgi:hypothetical protein